MKKGSKVFLVSGPEGSPYPINMLRNLAIKSATTKYVMMLDADFQPCPDMESELHVHLHKSKYGPKDALVIPAFEFLEMPNVRTVKSAI